MKRLSIHFVLICLVSLVSCNLIGQKSLIKGLYQTPSSELAEGKVPDIIAERNISISNGEFVDATGRTMFLRGINLGGSTKMPYSPRVGSHVREDFFKGKEVSFVGRPFPLKDADEHFSRLKAWGYHFLRFLVTWEAIEHEGPGVYDEEYLDYVVAILTKANEYGFNVLIDPHQDLWSRYTGGDGAPMWTFEVAGMDVKNFQETGAAFVHNIYGDPYPRMIWFSNYYKLGSATMFTLFFGGNDYAPNLKVDDVPIQDYLQNHYINALSALAKKVAHLPNVVGFELMNEPSSGYIGLEDITQSFNTDILGEVPTPLEGMALGNGHSLEIQEYSMGAFSLKDEGKKPMNINNLSAWQKGIQGVWKDHGVWDVDAYGKPIAKKKDYFSNVNGETPDFNERYYEPFTLKYADAIRAIDPNWIICVDNVLFPLPHPLPELKKYDEIMWVNGSHWYDDVTLVKKQYLPFLGLLDGKLIIGKNRVRKAYEGFLAGMIEETHKKYGNMPSLLGEFGIPFDMNKAKAYQSGDFTTQSKALDRSFRVIEKNNLHYTLWNYTADNTNERGDQWNGEDLSIFSYDQQQDKNDINSGGRALDAAIRPYPKKLNGHLVDYQYDYKKKELLITIEVKQVNEYPTEVYLPEFVYGNDFKVYASEQNLAYDREERILLYTPKNMGIHKIIVQNQ